ncbi:MAG: PIN domain-containing protein [Planctomycetaceae bacterium]|nr:PIN domain-containing protein [Planctomycetaceae bacterium]
MTEVFADTVYYLALLNFRDELHGRAVELTPNYDGRLLTTTWVLTELADALCRPPFRSTVVEFIAALRIDPQVTILPSSQELFDRGFDLFARRADKEWSLTDCISCVAMQEHGLSDALTSDHHFEQMGFRTLL